MLPLSIPVTLLKKGDRTPAGEVVTKVERLPGATVVYLHPLFENDRQHPRWLDLQPSSFINIVKEV